MGWELGMEEWRRSLTMNFEGWGGGASVWEILLEPCFGGNKHSPPGPGSVPGACSEEEEISF